VKLNSDKPRLGIKIIEKDVSSKTFAKEVVRGLSSNPKTLQPKYFYDEAQGRIEMHIESLDEQIVTINNLNQQFRFGKGETIHTENSYKYSIEQIRELAYKADFRLLQHWIDEKEFYSLNLLSSDSQQEGNFNEKEFCKTDTATRDTRLLAGANAQKRVYY
jgi:uncharacterized SAM-dependent methyltransferase